MTEQSLPNFDEFRSSHLPALQLLIAMGYSYLSPDEALQLRGGINRNVILTGILESWLKQHNHFDALGSQHSFNDEAIRESIRRLEDVPMTNGFLPLAREKHELLTLGISLKQFVEGQQFDPSFHFIDWQHPEENVFHVSEEFAVERQGMHETYRPDIVCFVNGIPFAILECKRPDPKSELNGPMHSEAISQHLRNQEADGIPQLYVFAPILLALSVNQASYGTTAIKKNFYTVWHEENQPETFEGRVHSLINQGIPTLDADQIFAFHKTGRQNRLAYERQGPRLPSIQDLTLAGLLQPARLLEISRFYNVFDASIRKIARYQQYFAIKETLSRVAALNPQGQRTGGIVWHTTGSGKSLTMVMLARILLNSGLFLNPRIILVTDRVNLDKQITDTFDDCDLEIKQATSGKDLMELVRGNTAALISTVINKFERSAGEKVIDDSPNIFVMVDESHRTQYGLIHNKMKSVFPNACYIGFTGTPLTKKEKSTARQFGSFIHKYNMRQAVADGAVLPLIYEGRLVELDADQPQLDRWFERHTASLTDEQKADLKHKMSRASVVNESERRIQEIAYDLSRHFYENYKRSNIGLKAQLATTSKQTALRYRKYINECGLLSCEVIISGPDTREGHDSIESADTPAVQRFWKDMMHQYGNEKKYNDSIIAQFSQEEGLDLIIVVDKLLVGFDEPRNTVLYLDKPLKDHSILQAIARVNRVYGDAKDFGYVVDYRGVLGELNEAIEVYDALADFETEDVAGTLLDVRNVLEKLPQHHSDLWAVFQGSDTADMQAMIEFLRPEDVRQRFYEALTRYTSTLRAAEASNLYYQETRPELIVKYKKDLADFVKLRQSVKVVYAEAVDFRDYEKKIRNLLDDHIRAGEVRLLTEQVSIFDVEAFDEAVAELGSPRAKAEAILNHMKRTALEKLDQDPAYYRKFSELIEETLKAIAEGRLSELDGFKKAAELRDEFLHGNRRDLPADLGNYRDAPAYYGIMEEVMKNRVIRERKASFAIDIEKIIEYLKIVDWQYNHDVQNRIRQQIQDAIYELEDEQDFQFTAEEVDEITNGILDVAIKRS